MPWFAPDEDVQLFYTDDGAGPAVLLLHGWACDGADWMHQVPALSRQFRVLVPDNRGHGRSTGHAGLTPRGFAADSAALLRHLGVEQVVAVGHSLGGLIASALAVEHPGLVRGVAVVDPAYGVEGEAAARVDRLLALVQQPGSLDRVAGVVFPGMSNDRTPPHLPAWHRRRVLGMPEDVVRDTFVGIFGAADQFGRRPQTEAYLAGRRCPVLAVYAGTHNPKAAWERTLMTTRHDEVHTMDTGHWPHQERPEEYNRLLVDWLGRLPA